MIESSMKKKYDIFIESQIVLYDSDIKYFPINMVDVIKKRGDIILTTKSEYNTSAHKSMKTKDGRTFFEPKYNVYMIVYDENQKKERINFTLAHEYGHIILGHLDDDITELDRGGISKDMYFEKEEEADTFAGNFLIPPVILNEHIKLFDEFNVNTISSFFNVSKTAVNNYRRADYDFWLTIKKHKYIEYKVLKKYGNLLYPKQCKNRRCNFIFYDEKYLFCVYCGKPLKYIFRGEETKMKYKQLENNKCRLCDNEEIIDDYCHICGSYQKNSCSKCSSGNFIPSNARYCPYCGSETSYKKMLITWQEEQNLMKENQEYSIIKLILEPPQPMYVSESSFIGETKSFEQLQNDDDLPF